MAGNRSVAYGELGDSIIVGVLVVDCLRVSACGSYNLLGEFILGVVVILDGINNTLGSYEVVRYNDIRFGGADDSTFLVLIIILLICGYVNRTDDISGAVVDIEKLRTS